MQPEYVRRMGEIMNVRTAEDDEVFQPDEPIIICCRPVEDREIPPLEDSTQINCQFCRCQIWIAPSSVKVLQQYQRAVALCPICAYMIAEKAKSHGSKGIAISSESFLDRRKRKIEEN